MSNNIMKTLSRETREMIEWEHEDKIGEVYGKELDSRISRAEAKAARDNAKANREMLVATSQSIKTLDDLLDKYFELDPTDPKTPYLSDYLKKQAKDQYDIELP